MNKNVDVESKHIYRWHLSCTSGYQLSREVFLKLSSIFLKATAIDFVSLSNVRDSTKKFGGWIVERLAKIANRYKTCRIGNQTGNPK